MNNLHQDLLQYIKKNDLDNIKILVSKGIDIRYNYDEAISQTMLSKNFEIFEYFLNLNPDILSNTQLLVTAFYSKDLNNIVYLMDKGFQVDSSIDLYDDFLTYNIKTVNIPIIELILQTPNKNKKLLEEAYLLAIEYQNTDVISCFLNHGISISFGNEALIKYALTVKKESLLKFALEKGAKVDFLQNQFIKNMATIGNLSFLKILQTYGANIHASQIYGEYDSVIGNASMNGHIDIVQYLIEQNVKDVESIALLESSRCSHTDICKLLLQHYSYDDEIKYKAFINAVTKKNLELVMHFSDIGVDLFSHYFKAVGIVRENEDIRMAQYFYEKGLQIEMFLGCESKNIAQWANSIYLSNKLNKNLANNNSNLYKNKI